MQSHTYAEPYLSSEALYLIFEYIVPELKSAIFEHKTDITKHDSLNSLITHDNPTISQLATTCYSHLLWQKCLNSSPNNAAPSDDVMAKIFASFGSLEKFHAEFYRLATFNARYIYLVHIDGKLQLMNDKHPTNPLTLGVPVLACNLWEHAYYLDYRQRRMDYVRDFLHHLINWAFVRSCLFSVKAIELD